MLEPAGGPSQDQRADYCFIGQNTLGLHALSHLIELVGPPVAVLTRPSSPDWSFPVATFARELGLPHLLVGPTDLTLAAGDAIEALKSCSIAVCAGWPARIGTIALSAPPRGIINLHPGFLPLWAGSDPIGWHLAAGWASITCTVHVMTETPDSGPVLATGDVGVTEQDTAYTLRVACGRQLGWMAADVVRGRTMTVVAEPPPAPVVPPRGTRPAFRARDMPTRKARRLIQAFSPYPGAVVQEGGRWLEVILPASRPESGTVLRCSDGELLVEVLSA